MPTTSRGLITAVAGALAVALTLTYNLGPVYAVTSDNVADVEQARAYSD